MKRIPVGTARGPIENDTGHPRPSGTGKPQRPHIAISAVVMIAQFTSNIYRRLALFLQKIKKVLSRNEISFTWFQCLGRYFVRPVGNRSAKSQHFASFSDP